MTKRLFDVDPISGITTYFEYDADTDETKLIYQPSSVAANLEAAKSLKNDEEYTRKGMKNDMLHYAHIPDSILLKWHTEGVDIHDSRALLAKVNSPEYANLRVTTKYHGKPLYQYFI